MVVSGIIGFVAATIGQATTGTGKPQLPPLTQEEQQLYEKIVKDLVASFSAAGRVEGSKIPTVTPKPERPQYAIIFRQSKSWATVERLLTEVSDPKHPKIKQWIAHWRQRVALLRQAYNEVQECLKKLKEIDAAREALRASRFTGLTQAHWQKFRDQEFPLKGQIKDHLKKMRDTLRDGQASFTDFDQDLLKLDAKFAKVHTHLVDNWHYLLVFSQWYEASPDDDGKIFVKVLRPTDDLTKTMNTTMKNPLREMVNVSTKAIFLIEETKRIEFSMPPFEGEEQPGKISRPVAVGLKHKQLAPLTPDPKVKHSSDYEVCDDIIFNAPFPAGSKMAQPRSQIAMRLQRVVFNALYKVNQELAKITKPEDIKISDKLKEAAEAEEKGGLTYTFNRYLVSFVPAAIPEMLGEWWNSGAR